MTLPSRRAFLVLALTACHAAREEKHHGSNETLASPTNRMTTLDPKIDRKCDFSVVKRSYGSNPCSPVLADEHADVIWINAPEQVDFDASEEGEPLRECDAHFVVCGSMNMRTETLHSLRVHEELEELLIVAVDTRTRQSYTGHIPRLGTRIPMPQDLRARTPPVFGYIIGRSFNPNLVRAFDLPAVETDYDVHVVLGPIKSNVLRVRLRRKK